jgi:hypothetical protein
MLAFSVPPGYRRRRPPTRPKLDPFTGIIDGILTQDEGRPRKQRHTSKRIASVLPEQAPEIANGRVVVAHLGNGCSACAMRNRISMAATMGFTALDGLPTRSGHHTPNTSLTIFTIYLLSRRSPQIERRFA